MTAHPDLFPVPPSPSPKRLWLTRNGIVTRFEERDPDQPWRATKGTQTALGMTEDGALVALCAVLHLKLWNE